MKTTYSADDLGTIYYEMILSLNDNIADSVNFVLKQKHEKYEIVHINVKKKYFFFGDMIVSIVLEDPKKIKELEGTQHYSKSYRS